jgi:hypothetical protein
MSTIITKHIIYRTFPYVTHLRELEEAPGLPALAEATARRDSKLAAEAVHV